MEVRLHVVRMVFLSNQAFREVFLHKSGEKAFSLN